MKHKIISIIAIYIISAFPQATLLNQKLQTVFATYSAAGISVAVVKNDSLVYSGSLGLRDVGRNLPVNNQTMYRIASISKTIAATTLMTLYDQGLFNLDADVSTYLGYTLRNPYFPVDIITIRKILSHTASLRDGSGYDSFLSATASQNPPPELKSLLLSGGSYFSSDMWSSSKSPNSNYFTYSNIDYGLIGTLIERLSGTRFDIACRNRVLLPLGIAGSYNIQDIDSINNVAVLYRKSGSIWNPQADNFAGVKPSPRNLSSYVIGTNGLIFSPAGGLRISAPDLARFVKAHLNNGTLAGTRIISDSAISIMHQPAWIYNGSNGDNYYGIFNTYGLGCHSTIDLLPGETLYGHPGEAYGLISDMYFSKEKNYGIIFITNGAVWGYGVYSGWYNMEEDVYKAALLALPGFVTAINERAADDYTFKIEQNYPNPFNPATTIAFVTPTSSIVNIAIYNVLGQKVAEPANEVFASGRHEISFNANNLPAGIYFCKIICGSFSKTIKMNLMK